MGSLGGGGSNCLFVVRLGEMDALTGRCTAFRYFTVNIFISINQYIDRYRHCRCCGELEM